MTSEYTYGENYFIIVSPQMMEMSIPEAIKEKLEYKNNYNLYDAAYIKRELTDGNYVISIQLSPSILIDNNCVRDFINKKDFELAKLQFGVEEFLTIQEFKKLNFKDE
jgi:hypothetical protein